MKILEVASDIYPFVTYGGIEKVAYFISREFSKNGHEVTVLTCTNDMVKVDMDIRRVPDLRVGGARGALFIASSILYFLWKRIRKQVDIVHMHGASGTNRLNSLCRKFGIPVVLTVHGKVVDDKKLGGWMDNFDAVTCVSKQTKKEAEKIMKKKCKVIHNGIDPKQFSYSEPEKKSAKEWVNKKFGKKLNVLFVGRFMERKGVLDLCNISGKTDANIIMAGHGPLDSELRRKSRSIKNLHVLGLVSDNELRRLYLGCDVCIFPSHFEPFGVVILEAMAFGKPVIASNVGGISEIIRSGEGILVEPKDVSGFARAIKSLESEERRNQLSRNGFKRVKDFYWADIAEEYLKVFENART